MERFPKGCGGSKGNFLFSLKAREAFPGNFCRCFVASVERGFLGEGRGSREKRSENTLVTCVQVESGGG